MNGYRLFPRRYAARVRALAGHLIHTGARKHQMEAKVNRMPCQTHRLFDDARGLRKRCLPIRFLQQRKSTMAHPMFQLIAVLGLATRTNGR